MRYWLGYFKRRLNTAWVERGNISHCLYILLQWSTCMQLVTTAVPGNRAGVCVGNEQIATICDSTSLVHCIMWETGLDSPEICFHLLRDNKVQPKGIYQSTRLLWTWLWAFPLNIWHSKTVRQNRASIQLDDPARTTFITMYELETHRSGKKLQLQGRLSHSWQVLLLLACGMNVGQLILLVQVGWRSVSLEAQVSYWLKAGERRRRFNTCLENEGVFQGEMQPYQ